ncbi:hypothetical protein AJ79_05848 [Helicocarpus griseus UAMH5409]|uniref:Glycosylphosphatidylinositol anchor biosynthesis protein 11 n=1 Tax=Helicocarpus griseus UAMH5409 TaxID=1447875 RepID=A0A2B7XB18_9EURO|nr:hypothetical protein AJ79_05848 [Helicocarpus griseus UAMH5409]
MAPASPSKPPSTTTSTPQQPSQHPQSQSQTRQPHPPVSILSSPAAQTYAHLHPLLLLCLFALRFGALVDDPVSTLLGALPLLALLQGVYAVVCLPAAGGSGESSSSSSGKGKGSGGGGGKKRPHGGHGHGEGGKIIPALLSLSLPLLLGTPLLSLLLCLFGAPFTTHIPHTILCAAHMALLAGTSLIYVHGTDGAVWREIWGISRAIDAVWGAAVGTGLGAWFGAVPIPLDWDRPWQAYPVTIITGAYVGYVLGGLVGRTPLVFGKRIQFAAGAEEGEAEGVGEAVGSEVVSGTEK